MGGDRRLYKDGNDDEDTEEDEGEGGRERGAERGGGEMSVGCLHVR